jgi:hypothetical protein
MLVGWLLGPGGAACARPAASDGSASVRGVLVEITPRSFNELEAIRVQTEAGAVMDFLVAPDAGLTPSHAREHMVLVEPITVFYRSTVDGLLAHSITD